MRCDCTCEINWDLVWDAEFTSCSEPWPETAFDKIDVHADGSVYFNDSEVLYGKVVNVTEGEGGLVQLVIERNEETIEGIAVFVDEDSLFPPEFLEELKKNINNENT